MREELIDEIRSRVVAQLVEKSPWIPEEEIASEANLFRDWSMGLGPFTELMEKEEFTDLFINGEESAWINRGNGLEPLAMQITERALINFVRAHALRAGKLFDPAHPSVDLELDRGVRLHALLPPIIEGGIHLSLRVNQKRALVGLNRHFDEVINAIIKSRKNFLISGGTGSGKTTLLSHLISAMPTTERLMVIEDTHEIQAEHPHLLRLQARERNSEGFGEIPIRELIRQALRMKPDRIFLGEVRGSDVLDLFLALNTGHAGSGGTIHANSTRDIPNRIAALAMTTGIPREAALALCASAIEIIIHLDGQRAGNRIASISIVEYRSGDIAIRELISVPGEFSAESVAQLESALHS